MDDSPQRATPSRMWRAILIVVVVIVIDLIVVLFSERQYDKMIRAPITREDANDPAKPQLYNFDTRRFQLDEAAEVCRFKIRLAVIIFSTLGIFIAGKQCGKGFIRSILYWIFLILVAAEFLLFLTAAILVIEFEGWRSVAPFAGWHAWLMNLVRASWFGFVLLRLVILFLAAVAVWRLWHWSRIVGASIGWLLVIGVTTFCVVTSYSPAGVYGYVDEIERWPDEDHYWRFESGKFEEISKSGVNQWGHYEKTADGWILTWADSRYRLRSSWLGISQCDVEFPDHCSFLGRRILPFLRPARWPYWLQ